MKKEYREITLEVPTEESRLVTGKCVCFESWSEDLGFREIIHKGAITQETINNSDIIMNYQHDDNKMLARSNKGVGSLNVELREDGLYISFEAPTTPLGDEMLYHLRNNNLNSMSFAFTMPNENNSERWYKDDNGILCREINKIDLLWDAAIVQRPAYSDTNVSARSKEIAQNALKEIEQREKDNIIEKLNTKYNEFIKNINL